jgi:hypothetical protein
MYPLLLRSLVLDISFRVMRLLRPGRETTITAVHISIVHHASIYVSKHAGFGLNESYFLQHHPTHSLSRYT